MLFQNYIVRYYSEQQGLPRLKAFLFFRSYLSNQELCDTFFFQTKQQHYKFLPHGEQSDIHVIQVSLVPHIPFTR